MGAKLSVHIPPKIRRRGRHPIYISPNTGSFTVGVQFVTASPWPSLPTQTLVVATPQPCATAAGGGYNCNFTVQVYAGKNVFTFNEYQSKSPSPQDTPLATLTTGVTTVSGTNPSLNFTLEGVVAGVILGVPNPESTHDAASAVTQPIPIGTATTFPLYITPEDASRAQIAASTFSSPITISASPASAGVTLSLAKQCAGDTSSATSVTLNCAADLNQVTVAYDGSVTRASGVAYVDTATISAVPQLASPSPVPARVALTSNVLAYQLVPGPGGGNPYADLSDTMALSPTSGMLAFAYAQSGASGSTLAEFNPSSPTTLTTGTQTYYAYNLAFDASGNLWTDDQNNPYLHCLSGISAAPTTLSLTDNLSNTIAGPNLTRDASGNLWFSGGDSDENPAAGYFQTSTSCATAPTSATAQFTFGNQEDSIIGLALAPPTGGNPGVFVPDANYSTSTYTLYGMNTATTASPTPVASFGPSTYPVGIVSDAGNNAYVATQNDSGQTASGAVEEVAAGSTTLASLVSFVPSAYIYSLAQYSGSQSTAQALLGFDGNNDAMVLVSPVASTTEPLEATLTNVNNCGPSGFDANGGAWVICSQSDGSVWAYHPVVTSTWSVLPQTYYYYYQTENAVVPLPETGSNGPFTVTVNPSPSVVATGTPFPTASSFPHAIPIEINGAGTDTLTIADKNGRTSQVTLTVIQESGDIRRRHHHHRAHRPGRPQNQPTR